MSNSDGGIGYKKCLECGHDLSLHYDGKDGHVHCMYKKFAFEAASMIVYVCDCCDSQDAPGNFVSALRKMAEST